MAKVRLEEKSKFHKEFDNLKRELERNYEMKAKALMEREKNAIEGLQKHKEVNICKHLFFFPFVNFCQFNGNISAHS